jgi:hypothetical protein
MTHACSGFHRSSAITRRRLLHAGMSGMLGLTLPQLLRASSQYGGPAAPGAGEDA